MNNPQLTAQLRIGNEDLDQGSGGTFEHRHPLTGEVQYVIPLAGKAEVDRAVEAAAAAFPKWRCLRPEVRRDILIKFAQLILKSADEFARLAAHDGGTPLRTAKAGARLAYAWASYFAGWADKLDGQLLSTFDTRGELSYTMAEPIGVVGIIITWNGPLISLGMKVVPALAAGNCVVVKPPELTPFVPDLFARLAREAGVPAGVLSMLPGTVAAGDALVRHPLVEKISFTGGIGTARKILTACAESLKPVVLELGGKSASLVFPDADIDAACQRAVSWTIGFLSGQACAMPTRLLVHESIYEQVIDKVVAIARAYKVGDPFEDGVIVGPLINQAACDRIMGMLDRVRSEKSGRIVLGGGRVGGAFTGKNFIEPTIVVDVDPKSEIGQVEVFGPVLAVLKFSSEEEALAIANGTTYGLAAYIESNDVKRVHRLAERLKAGGVYVNGGYPASPLAPFGGVGSSGYGKEGGRRGIDEFLRYKTVSIA
jgi:aldehyde dehydrogenase (NAD+)